MGPKTTQLYELLLGLSHELERAGHAYWAGELTRDAELLARGDFGGIERFVNSFGGSGSLSDLSPPSASWSRNLASAWELAKEIEREVRFS